MGKVAVGERVGAILSADKKEVRLLGYGTYEGELPVKLYGFERNNPCIKLDDGRGIVWGFMCWWGSEAQVQKMIGDRKVVLVDVPVPIEADEAAEVETD